MFQNLIADFALIEFSRNVVEYEACDRRKGGEVIKTLMLQVGIEFCKSLALTRLLRAIHGVLMIR
jgi:hypothetical protein